MILRYFRGPGAHFGDPGPHFGDFFDFCDFEDTPCTKKPLILEVKIRQLIHFLQYEILDVF